MEVEQPEAERAEQSEVIKRVPRIISFFANKGGVGKTTATFNIAAQLAAMGMRAGIADCDSQCNVSTTFIKYKLNFDTDFCPYTNELHKKKILEKMSTALFLGGDKPLSLPKQYDIEIDASEYADKADLDDALRSWDEDQEPELVRFLLHKVGDEWFFRGAMKQGAEGASPTSVPATRITKKQITKKDEHGEPYVDFESEEQTIESFFADEWGRIISDQGLAAIEKRQAIFFALECLGYDHIEYATNELLGRLHDFDIHIHDEGTKYTRPERASKDAYILTRISSTWRLYHITSFCAGSPQGKKEIGIAQIRELCDYLAKIGGKQPSHINEPGRSAIKAYIRKYRQKNLCEFLSLDDEEPVTLQDWAVDARRATLLSAKPPLESGTGMVYLLPGSYDLQLELGDKFSSAVRGLKDKSLRPYVTYIYQVRHKLVEICRLHGIDYLVLDLNPAASSINQVLMMISDGVLTTANPEEYNGSAMEGFRRITEKWAGSFQKTFERRTPYSGYPAITQPPQFLGFFYQKVERKRSVVADEYRAEIKRIYEKSVIPSLMKVNMYPKLSGVYGYTANGHPEKDSHPGKGIPIFGKALRMNFRLGMPIAWKSINEKDKVAHTEVRKRLKDVVCQTIGYHVVTNPGFSPQTKNIFLQQIVQDAKVGRARFTENWAQFHKEWRDSLMISTRESLARRAELIKNLYYRLDPFDMFLLLMSIRHNKLRPKDSAQPFYAPFCENRGHALIFDPCIPDTLSRTLQAGIDHVLAKWENKKIAFFMMPYFIETEWFCLRIEIIVDRKVVEINIDDPQGREILIDEDFNVGEANQKGIKKVLKKYLDDTLSVENASGFDFLWYDKKIDQQGFDLNDVDSGVIILSNIKDYMIALDQTQEPGGTLLLPNRCFRNVSSARSQSTRNHHYNFTLGYKKKEQTHGEIPVNMPGILESRRSLSAEYLHVSKGFICNFSDQQITEQLPAVRSNVAFFNDADTKYVSDRLNCFKEDILGDVLNRFEDAKKRGLGFYPSAAITLSVHIFNKNHKLKSHVVSDEHKERSIFSPAGTKRTFKKLGREFKKSPQKRHRNAASPGPDRSPRTTNITARSDRQYLTRRRVRLLETGGQRPRDESGRHAEAASEFVADHMTME